MKTKTNLPGAFFFLLANFVFYACQKNDVAGSSSDNDNVDTENIAVATVATATGGNTNKDSVYLMQAYGRKQQCHKIAKANLPPAISTHLAANYAGATFSAAFVITNPLSNVAAYIVMILYNNKPVGLRFDSNGNFLKVVDQRTKRHLSGIGYRLGGQLEHRGGKGRDTFSTNDLPFAVADHLAILYHGPCALSTTIAGIFFLKSAL